MGSCLTPSAASPEETVGAAEAPQSSGPTTELPTGTVTTPSSSKPPPVPSHTIPTMAPPTDTDPGTNSGTATFSEEFIPTASLPRYDPFSETQADWRWEKEAGQWRSYAVHESIELERHWQAFEATKASGGGSRGKIRVGKNEVVIDFARLTAQAGDGRPRRIQRQVKASDWLSNAYFFDAFKECLRQAGINVDKRPEEMFEFRYVQDFRDTKDDGRKMYRGGKEYHLPVGWKRFAVQVRGLYDAGDNAWLREDESGWAVAYHGTSKEGLPGILSSGFRVGDRQKFEAETGAGVYCTPEIDVAQHYSKPTMLRGRSVQIVLQLRVKPETIHAVTDAATAFERKYWVINKPDDIRAYGVLIREFPLAQWIPPEVMVYGREHPAIRKILDDLKEEVRKQEQSLR